MNLLVFVTFHVLIMAVSALVNPYTDFLAVILKDLTKSRPELSTSIQSINALYDAEFEKYCFTPFADMREFPSKAFYEQIVSVLRVLNNPIGQRAQETMVVGNWLRVEMRCYLNNLSLPTDTNKRFEQFCGLERLFREPPTKASELAMALRRRTDGFVQSATVDKVLLRTLFLGIRLAHTVYESCADKTDMPSINADIISAFKYAMLRSSQVRRFSAVKSSSAEFHMRTDTINISPFRAHDQEILRCKPPSISRYLTMDMINHAVTLDNPRAWLKSFLGQQQVAQPKTELILENMTSKPVRPLPRIARVLLTTRQSSVAPQLTNRDPFSGLPSCIFSMVLRRFGNTRTHLQFLKLLQPIDDALQEIFTTGIDRRHYLHTHLNALVKSKTSQKKIVGRMMSADLVHLVMLIHNQIRMTTVLVLMADFLGDDSAEYAQYSVDEWAMLREFKKVAASSTLASINVISRASIDSILAAFKKSMFMVLRYCSFASKADEIRTDVSAYLAHIQLNSP